ncbi:hypothetical protein BC834DRAFT_907062 [Gloeopeniophorella convolvens]|nr:hypothetical protein BC834DRAFT_907062 [Gloeopeniophorella convolvens]
MCVCVCVCSEWTKTSAASGACLCARSDAAPGAGDVPAYVHRILPWPMKHAPARPSLFGTRPP